MNYLDLFSGIGGFSLGLKQAGFKFDKHYFSEVDKYAIEVYQKQFPEAEGLGSVSNIQIRYSDSKEGKIGKGKTRIQSDRNSIRGQRNNDNSGQWSKQIDTNKHKETPEAIEYIKVRQNEQLLQRPINSRNIEECGEQSKLNTIKPKRNNNTKTTITTPNGTFQFFGKIDLITFGFPCQDLSIAGKRAGLKGSRSGLFFEATKIINVCKPSYFIFENVKGLFSSNNGECFKACLQEIADIGYDGQWQLLNTRWWLPQNRERIYFVGHIRGERRPEVFPIGENGQEPQNIQRQTSGEQQRIFSEVQESRDGDNGCPESGRRSEGRLNQIGIIGKDSEATRVYSPDGIARTIKNGGGQGAKTGLYEVSSTINKIGNLKGKGGHECHNVHDPKGIAPTVRENHGKITMIEQDIHGVELKAKPMQWRRSEKGRKARKEAMEKGKDITPFSDGHRELVESDKNEIGCITNALNKDALLSVSPTIDTTYGRTSTSSRGKELVPRTAGLANTGLYQINNLDGANGHEANKVSHNNDIQQTLRANCGGKLKGIGYQDADNRIRRLTPTECERLQGFPDGWTEGLSDTQRYKTLGNAVSVPVVKAVVERLIHKSSKSHNLHKDS